MPEQTTGQPALGRRERKKAATRKALADAALRLFLERGYDDVGIREIADTADVSTTTLFKHFPSKEALVFDREDDTREALLAAVRERGDGQSIPDALRQHVLRERLPRSDADADMTRFLELVEQTPALREYARKMWLTHETDLAAAIADEAGARADDPACRALAHFALDAAALAGESEDPDTAIGRAFDVLEHGWASAVDTP